MVSGPRQNFPLAPLVRVVLEMSLKVNSRDSRSRSKCYTEVKKRSVPCHSFLSQYWSILQGFTQKRLLSGGSCMGITSTPVHPPSTGGVRGRISPVPRVAVHDERNTITMEAQESANRGWYTQAGTFPMPCSPVGWSFWCLLDVWGSPGHWIYSCRRSCTWRLERSAHFNAVSRQSVHFFFR